MKMKKSIVVLLVVLAIIGVAAAIGIAASKQNGQGQNNNDQGCKPGSTKSCYTGLAGTVDVGLCKAGTKTCNPDGEWSRCIGQVTPTAEVCNGLDDDCNGVPDNGDVCVPSCAGIGEPCTDNGDCCSDGCCSTLNGANVCIATPPPDGTCS